MVDIEVNPGIAGVPVDLSEYEAQIADEIARMQAGQALPVYRSPTPVPRPTDGAPESGGGTPRYAVRDIPDYGALLTDSARTPAMVHHISHSPSHPNSKDFSDNSPWRYIGAAAMLVTAVAMARGPLQMAGFLGVALLGGFALMFGERDAERQEKHRQNMRNQGHWL